MSLDKFARKFLSKFHSNSLNIHQNMSRLLLLEKNEISFSSYFGPKALLKRAAHGGARPMLAAGPRAVARFSSTVRPGWRHCRAAQLGAKPARRRAQAATWAWAGNPTLALFPPGPDLAQHGHRFISTIDYHPTDLLVFFWFIRNPLAADPS
jgi:hypothetical protein